MRYWVIGAAGGLVLLVAATGWWASARPPLLAPTPGSMVRTLTFYDNGCVEWYTDRYRALMFRNGKWVECPARLPGERRR